MRRTGMMRSWPLAVCFALTGALMGTDPATEACAEDAAAVKAAGGTAAMDAERASRWQAIAVQIFGERKIDPTDTLIRLDAPARAEDAALVPITLTMPEKDKIKSVYLVIDDNPAPFAARVTFGPAADAGTLQLRVRIDAYTNVHAVADLTRYLTALRDGTRQAIAAGVSISDAVHRVAQSERSRWALFDDHHARNVIQAYKVLEWE